MISTNRTHRGLGQSSFLRDASADDCESLPRKKKTNDTHDENSDANRHCATAQIGHCRLQTLIQRTKRNSSPHSTTGHVQSQCRSQPLFITNAKLSDTFTYFLVLRISKKAVTAGWSISDIVGTSPWPSCPSFLLPQTWKRQYFVVTRNNQHESIESLLRDEVNSDKELTLGSISITPRKAPLWIVIGLSNSDAN